MAIKTFRDKVAAATFLGLPVKSLPPSVRKRAIAKLQILHAAQRLQDLRVPPANRLEALRGGRSGQHSVRINDQWRVCFAWHDGNAFDVEIVDYH